MLLPSGCGEQLGELVEVVIAQHVSLDTEYTKPKRWFYRCWGLFAGGLFENMAAMAPARPQLRKLLNEFLRSDSDLEAFCSDYFPAERARFTLGMERSHKLTVLLDHADAVAIADALRRAYPEAGPKIDEALASDLRAVESVDRSDGDAEEPSCRGVARSRGVFLVAASVFVALALGGAIWKLGSRGGQPPRVEAVGEPPPGPSVEAVPRNSAPSFVAGDAGDDRLHAAPAPAPSASHGKSPSLPDTSIHGADCAGEELAEPRCSYRGTLRNEQGAPLSEADVELLGTSCVRRTNATGGFDFVGCDPIALARLSNPRVFVRLPGGKVCYGTKLLKPPLMTEIKISQNNRCPKGGIPTKPPATDPTNPIPFF